MALSVSFPGALFPLGVTPAKAGTSVLRLVAGIQTGVPAFAGMTWWMGYWH